MRKIKDIWTKFLTKRSEDGGKLLTVKQVAKLLDKSEKAVYYDIKVGKLQVDRRYGKLLVRESSLESLKK